MLRYRLARPWLAALRAGRPLAGGNRGFRILLFHDVADHHLEVLNDLVADVKRTQGVLTPEEAEDWIMGRGRTAGRPPCLFNFDDGFASNLTAARRVLAPHGVKALFFVCPGLMDLPPDAQGPAVARGMFEGRRDAVPPLMTWEEVAQLADVDHVIGAHGMSHRRLSALSGADLGAEILDSGARIEARLSRPVHWFAYPFGDVDSIAAAALSVVAGRYRFCRSGVRGLNGAATPPHALRADAIDLAAPEAYRRLVAAGGLDFRYRRARRRLDAMLGED